MSGNLKILLFLTGIFLLMTVTLAFGFGPDVPIWTEGTVNCFDVDYATDGTMFVGFQAAGESTIRIYQSTDHGLTWGQIKTLPTNDPDFGTSSRSNLSRIRLLYDEPNLQLFVFFVDSAGYLYRHRLMFPGLDYVGWRVSTAPILEGSFDVTWDLKTSGRKIFVTWTTGNNAGDNIYIKSTTSVGPIESSWTTIDSAIWSVGGATRRSIAFGPPEYIFSAYSTKAYGGGSTDNSVLEIVTKRSHMPGIWDPLRLTNNSYMDYDPRVAAQNVDNWGVWTVYNRDRGGHEIDLYFHYSWNGGYGWTSEQTISAVTGVDEYIADIKCNKALPSDVNMVYIYDDPNDQPIRKAIWSYAEFGFMHFTTSWQGHKIFSDHDVTSWPEDVAPRIVYSPGAHIMTGASGVVFSYAGRNGLYFDASWITPMPLPSGPTAITYAYVADPVNSEIPANARPIGVGNIAGGTAAVRVTFSEFAGLVDIYIAIQIPGYADIQLLTPDNELTPLNWSSPTKWRTATYGPVDVLLFTYPRSLIPFGQYTVYTLVVPAGTNPATFNLATSPYYLWNFTVTN